MLAFDVLLDVFMPQKCLCCGEFFFYKEDGGDRSLCLCGLCMLEVPRIIRIKNGSDLIRQNYILSSYDGPLGFVLRAAKYGGNLPLMYSLGQFLASVVQPDLLVAYDGIVHVPTSTFRKIQRGFDQAEILSICISQCTKIHRFSTLKRIDNSEQSKKIGKERTNRKMRFRATELIQDRILLVDDVCTSGNTLEQCAQELICSGVKEVHAVSLLSRQI